MARIFFVGFKLAWPFFQLLIIFPEKRALTFFFFLSIRRGTSFSPSSTSNLLVCDQRDGVHRPGK